MKIFSPDGLAISLPGIDATTIDLPNSVNTPEAVLTLRLPPDLRLALTLVHRACKKRRVPIQIVARPEIFTHGESARWLRKKLGNIGQHLCITDGTTIKLIPECQNHAFFIRLQEYNNFTSLQRLSERAPELVVQLDSQINSAHALGAASSRYTPTSVYLMSDHSLLRPQPRALPFVINPHSADDTAARIELRGDVAFEQVPNSETLIYLPLSETALHDKMFARQVAHIIVRACLDRHILLVLRLPILHPSMNSLRNQIAALLRPLHLAHVTIPRNFQNNIILVTDDLAADNKMLSKRSWRLIVHESFDFWRHGRSFYNAASAVTIVTASRDDMAGAFLPMDITSLYGRSAERVWLTDAIDM